MKKEIVEIDVGYSLSTSLLYLVETLKARGITKKDYGNVAFKIDSSECYYAGDPQRIMAVYNPDGF